MNHTIDSISLMLIITAVDDKVWALQMQIDAADEDSSLYANLEDEQLRYMNIANELEQKYAMARLANANLPVYAELIKPWPEAGIA